jgi:hypothetical protein
MGVAYSYPLQITDESQTVGFLYLIFQRKMTVAGFRKASPPVRSRKLLTSNHGRKPNYWLSLPHFSEKNDGSRIRTSDTWIMIPLL